VLDFDPNRRHKFNIGKLKWHQRQNVPLSILYWLLAYEDYLQPFMRLPLPQTKNLTIERLRTVWDVLGTVVDAVLRRIPDKQPDRDWFLSHAVLLSRAELEDILTAHCRSTPTFVPRRSSS